MMMIVGDDDDCQFVDHSKHPWDCHAQVQNSAAILVYIYIYISYDKIKDHAS